MGRLTKDPEVRYSQGATPIAIANFTLAVDRRFKKDGEQNTDFIPCVALGKSGEFVEKYFKKGQLVSVVGRIQVRSWNDKEGNKRWSTEVITEEHYFAESKPKTAQQAVSEASKRAETHQNTGFYPIDENSEDDLPF